MTAIKFEDINGLAEFFKNTEREYNCVHSEYCGNTEYNIACKDCGIECPVAGYFTDKGELKERDSPPSY